MVEAGESTYAAWRDMTKRDQLAEGLKLLGVLDARGVYHKTGTVEVHSRANDLPPEAATYYSEGFRQERARQNRDGERGVA